MSDLQSRVFSISRPDRNLLTYYTIGSLILGPFFFIILIPLYFRYHTLHYQFDEEGISMRWGILFRREITLTYARIQDIHLTSNVIERWLGLARIQIQTASGNAGAEMVIEGLKEYDLVRDFLYSRMRGVHAERGTKRAEAQPGPRIGGDPLVVALHEVASELRAIRHELESKRGDVAP